MFVSLLHIADNTWVPSIVKGLFYKFDVNYRPQPHRFYKSQSWHRSSVQHKKYPDYHRWILNIDHFDCRHDWRQFVAPQFLSDRQSVRFVAWLRASNRICEWLPKWNVLNMRKWNKCRKKHRNDLQLSSLQSRMAIDRKPNDIYFSFSAFSCAVSPEYFGVKCNRPPYVNIDNAALSSTRKCLFAWSTSKIQKSRN